MDTDYRLIADEIEAAIRVGEIQPGQRLTPQRLFAWGRGIAISTASRVYAELKRRGLVEAEVGRGTFVLDLTTTGLTSLPDDFVDLEFNHPATPGQADLLAQSIAAIVTPSALARSMAPPSAIDLAEARTRSAAFLARSEWRPEAACVAFASNGREALAAALALVARPGDRLGAEAITYAVFKDIARQAGVELIPIPTDGEGLSIEGLHAAIALGVRGVYLQPTLHNPLGVTMSTERKRQIARLLEAHSLVAIEDAVNSFLVETPPLAAFAPGQTILVESLSKRVSPSVTLGYLVVPDHMRGQAREALRWATRTDPSWAITVASELIKVGAAASLAQAKQADALTRQALARRILDGLQVRADPRAYHLWLHLPDPWRAQDFVRVLASRGISVTPASRFAIAPGHAPAAVRLALGTPDLPNLERALRVVREVTLATPA